MAKISEKQLQYALYALIAVGVLATGYALVSNNFQIGGTEPTPTPTAAPEKAKLILTVITVPECRYCTDLTELIERIKVSNDVQVISEKSISYRDASDLIEKYGITKVPTIILSGETDKVTDLKYLWQQIGEEKPDGTLVLTKFRPMYYDLQKGDFVGKLKITRIANSTCDSCVKTSVIQANFEENTGIKFVEEQEREFNSTQGKALLDQYNITKIPTIIITGDVDAYNELGLKKEWVKIGSVEGDGALVWRLIEPPYQEYPSGKLRGFVTLIGIQDQDCKLCYDLEVHPRILTTLGIQFASISYYNKTNDKAKELIQKYNITLLPAVVLDPELKEYYPFTAVDQIWEQIGTVEKDGWHVFRNMSSLGANVTYKVTTTNETKTTV